RFSAELAIKLFRVHKEAWCSGRKLWATLRRDNLYNREIEGGGQGIITLIVSRHRHNGAGTVGSNHVVTNPDRQLFSGDRVKCIRASPYTALLLVQMQTL